MSLPQPPPKKVDIKDLNSLQRLVNALYYLWAYITNNHVYTVATVPPASKWGPSNKIIYVSDETGGPCLAFSNGTNWLRVRDNVIIS